MIFLGIDPGYERLGIAIVEKKMGSKDILIYSECFETEKNLHHPERLYKIGQRIEEVIENYKPNTLGIEALFFSVNQKTALLVSEARGVILAIAAKHSLEIMEFTPGEIKLAITGYGKADKQQVEDMLHSILTFPKKARDDEYDAIAVALTASIYS